MRQVGNVLAFYTRQDFLSNHYLCQFELHRVKFNSLEQSIMYAKAKLFDDDRIARLILQEPEPQRQKMLGRQVKPFDPVLWTSKIPIWYRMMLRAKYAQNPPLLDMLLATGELLLAEAAERDRIWGVGLTEDDPRIGDPAQWQGTNLCGAGNMWAREYFKRLHKDPIMR